MVEVEKLFDHESKLRPILVRPVRSPACLPACAECGNPSSIRLSSFSFGALMGCRATSPSRRSGAKKHSRSQVGLWVVRPINRSLCATRRHSPVAFCELSHSCCLFVDPELQIPKQGRHRATEQSLCSFFTSRWIPIFYFGEPLQRLLHPRCKHLVRLFVCFESPARKPIFASRPLSAP